MRRLQRFEPLGTAKTGSVGQLRNAVDKITGQLCVLKVAPSGSPGARVLADEAALLAEIEHPNIVNFVARIEHHPGFDGDGSISGLATLWEDAECLDAWGRNKSIHEKLDAGLQLCQAIHYLHRRGILHLDLKPANVLCADGHVTLLDFGTAQHVQRTYKQAGGTLGYAAPEIMERASASTESDIFSLGAILYALLTDHHAFDPAQVTRENFSQQVVLPLRALNSDVPKNVASLIQSMLSVLPVKRPSINTAVALLCDFLNRPVPPNRGAPPFLGREPQICDLLEVLTHQTEPIAIVGERGSGRQRLAQAVLARHIESSDIVDLGALANPVPALVQIIDEMERVETPMCILLPRQEAMEPDVVANVTKMFSTLTHHRIQVLWPSRTTSPLGRNFFIGPLDAYHLEQLAQFCGATTGTNKAQAFRDSNGFPGPLLRLLAPQETSKHSQSPEGLLLRSLPLRIPSALIEKLGTHYSEAAKRLVGLDEARLSSSDRLVVYAPIQQPITGHTSETVLAYAREVNNQRTDPLWCALVLCQHATPASAIPPFNRVPESERRTAAFKQLSQALSESGHDPATRTLAQLLLDDGEYDKSLAALDRLVSNEPDDIALVVHILRVAERYDECWEIIRNLTEETTPAPLLLEIIRLHISLEDFERATEAMKAIAPAVQRQYPAMWLGLRVQIAANLARSGEPMPRSLVDEVLNRRHDPDLPSFALAAGARAAETVGEIDVAMELYAERVQRADLMRNLRDSTSARLNLATAYSRNGRAESGRIFLIEALQGARKLDNVGLLLRVLYTLCDLELDSHRLPAAERYLAAFHVVAQRADSPELRLREAMLKASRFAQLGEPQHVLDVVEPCLAVEYSDNIRREMVLFAARAYQQLGAPEKAIALLDRIPQSPQEWYARKIALLRGQALVSLGRKSLLEARQGLSLTPDASARELTGQILLGAAGEDLDPETFSDRRADLTHAVRLLGGDGASKAVALRDRLLEGPGAGLSSMVNVIESMHVPASFPQALADLVAEALGANRVLIMVRIPGLGRQVTAKELTDGEAAGVSVEVLKRLQNPDDVWLSADAFADPHLRQVSATVRTFEIRSVLAVAIPLNGLAIGALYVDDKHRAGRFTDEDVAVLKRLALVAGRMIPLMRQNPTPRLTAPRNILGVLDTNPRRVAELELAVDRLRHGNQTNLLITGATGTGKTWLARKIATDLLGLRGIEEATMRQTDVDRLVGMLAGTRPGDFTGAIANDGLIQTCLREKRVLFLDEIQALDDDAQVALLPLLELPKRRFGGLTGSAGQLSKPLTIVLCTNVKVADGGWRAHFREDFWFRISQAHIDLAPLKDRGEEALYGYLQQFLASKECPSPSAVLKPEALSAITKMTWTGNLRELSKVANDLAYHWSQLKRPITLAELLAWRVLQPGDDGRITLDAPAPIEMTPFLSEVLALLPRFGWNQSKVARQMSTTVSRVNRSLKRAGLLGEVGRQRVENQHHTDGPNRT